MLAGLTRPAGCPPLRAFDKYTDFLLFSQKCLELINLFADSLRCRKKMYICVVVNIALQWASFFGQRQVKHSNPAVFFVG